MSTGSQQLTSKTSAPPAGAITLLKDDERAAIMQLDQTVAECNSQLSAASEQPMLRALTLARATNSLRNLLNEKMMKDLMDLMGSPLGFRTDRDKDDPSSRYKPEQVKDVAIVALLDGARFVGNEFNIIAGNYYRTKEQLRRRILEWPGLKNFSHQCAVPQSMGEKGALVRCVATWTVNGKRDEVRCEESDKGDYRIAIRVNAGQGADAILGKAERKLFLKVWTRLMGQDVADFDPDEDDAPQGDVVEGTATVVESTPPVETKPDVPGVRTEILALKAKFEAIDMVTDATKLHDAAAKSEGLTPEEEGLLKDWHKEACARIRSSRGPGSNKGATSAA